MSAPSTTGVATGVKSQKTLFQEEVRKLISAKYGMICIPTYEDQRCEMALKELAKQGFQTPLKSFTWTITQGLVGDAGVIANTDDPIRALDFVISEKSPTLFIFKDLGKWISQDLKLSRKLRDVYHVLRAENKTLVMLSPHLDITDEISKEVSVVEFKLPDLIELERLLDATIKSFKNIRSQLTADDVSDYVTSALGLTWDEAKNAFVKACTGQSVLTRDAIKAVIEEKCKIIKKDGILDYIPVDYGMQEIGGLNNLKSWLAARSRFFSKDAKEFGLTYPKGVLLTGISGCGKSSCVKAISQYWRLPLMRLDMTKVYGGTLGNPEETMRKALKTTEAVAPVILWIEEIEKGVAGFNQGDGGVTARIFSSFLTWMQEKQSIVFVAATANEIDKLPPELLRKGRFDEIFFVDLPTEAERVDIFTVHIAKRKHDPSKFALINLAKATNGFNGAEIEQVVAAGMFEAFNEKRHFNDQDLYKMISKTVPLSTTMSEPIKEIKRWADKRAVKAS